MSLLDKFKKKKPEKKIAEPADSKVEKKLKVKDRKVSDKVEKKVGSKSAAKKSSAMKTSASVKSSADKPTIKEKAIPKPSKDDTGDAYKILIQPLITEKITDLGVFNKYGFIVAPKASKQDIKRAIRSLYGVEPVKINIINMRGKYVRQGRSLGKRKDWKKAIITLKEGDTIEIYEGV